MGFEVEVEREAKAGADVIMLPELGLVTFQGPGVNDDRVSTEVVLERLSSIAQANNVFLGVGIGYNLPFVEVPDLSTFIDIALEKGGKGMMGMESNRFILVSPRKVSKEEFDEVMNGIQAHSHLSLDYRKKIPVPVIEMPFAMGGNDTIPVRDVDIFGTGSTAKISSVVCFDMEHPWHTKQLALSSDVILNPSYDWPGLNPYHARIVAFRAIETGNNIFHHCQAGTSMAYDYLGNVLTSGDYFSQHRGDAGSNCIPMKPEKNCVPPTHIANLPMVGVKTVYGVVGDVVVYTCLAITVALMIWSAGRK